MASGTIRTNLELEYLFCPGEGQVVPDTSINLFHGVLGLTSAVEPYGVGSPTADVVYDPTWVSNGVDLDSVAADYNSTVVRAPDDAMLLTDEWTDITMEVWFQPALPTLLFGFLVGLGNNGVALSTDDVVIYYHKDAFGRVEFDELDLTAGNLPPAGTWTHWIVTRTANDINWFINGALAQTKSLALDRFGNPHVANSKIAMYNDFPRPTAPSVREEREHWRLFGSLADGGTDANIRLESGYNGRIGELRIYSAALDATQALFNFNASNYYPDGKNSCGIGPASRYYAM